MNEKVRVKVEVNLTIKGGKMTLLLPSGFTHDDLLDAISEEVKRICHYNSLSYDKITIKEED